MTTDNLTTANAQGAESSIEEDELDYAADAYCDYMDDLCNWLDDENVNWKEKVDRILEECKKNEGLELISNEAMFKPIKYLFDVKSICDECDYYDQETDLVMNSFCVRRLRFDDSSRPGMYDKFSAVIYILEDGLFFIHHNYKYKDLLDNTIGCNFTSEFITNEYSDMLQFLLFSKNSIDEISSGIDTIKNFVGKGSYNHTSVYNNEIHFYDQHIELKFTAVPKIDSLIEVADAIYKMKEKYESENRGKN